jgi:hypothetical protein
MSQLYTIDWHREAPGSQNLEDFFGLLAYALGELASPEGVSENQFGYDVPREVKRT